MNDSVAAVDLPNAESWSGKHRGAENFPVGSVLIRADLRPHVHAFYDFARNADDIADSPDLAPHDKLARLDVMEAVLLGTRLAGSPSALGLRRSLAATGVDAVHSRDLLVAFRQDATKTRYASWDELLEYCRYSAMPVGRHVLALHGEPPGSIPASDALCAVLQVLNHLQDMGKDLAQLDRCYLPLDWLSDAGAAVGDVRRAATPPALRQVIARMLAECDHLNDIALALPAQVQNRRLRLETAVITGLARRLAHRLHTHDPLATRVKLRRAEMVGSVLAALRHLPGNRS